MKVLENATFAEPSTELPARFLAVVHFAALPVVFWLNVGKLVMFAALRAGAFLSVGACAALPVPVLVST